VEPVFDLGGSWRLFAGPGGAGADSMLSYLTGNQGHQEAGFGRSGRPQYHARERSGHVWRRGRGRVLRSCVPGVGCCTGRRPWMAPRAMSPASVCSDCESRSALLADQRLMVGIARAGLALAPGRGERSAPTVRAGFRRHDSALVCGPHRECRSAPTPGTDHHVQQWMSPYTHDSLPGRNRAGAAENRNPIQVGGRSQRKSARPGARSIGPNV
jgi:hypothetical protein